MKKTNFWLILGASFAGVFGALQVDHFLAHKPAANTEQTLPLANEVQFRQTDYDSAAPTGLVDFRVAAKKVNPSVVSVDRYEQVRRGYFDDSTAIKETGTGSGVIVSADGVIVTNNHVVADANGKPVSEVKVRLSDKRTLTAKVLGTDPRADLAVLRIDAKNLTPIEMGTSSDVEVGEWVLAVGNPLGFDNTVSVGVVSSLKRDLPIGVGGLVNAIQTDAAINPGNSGGALCDASGKLIGINSAIASENGGSVGIGFAIPVDRVKSVVQQIVAKGYASYAGIGVHYNPQLSEALSDPDARAYIGQQGNIDTTSMPKSGIVVGQAEGAAAAAGLKPFDVLETIDDTTIDTPFSLNRALLPHKPGDKVKVKYWSKGETKTATLTLQEVH
jgi:S1-C subfamily serine protease